VTWDHLRDVAHSVCGRRPAEVCHRRILPVSARPPRRSFNWADSGRSAGAAGTGLHAPKPTSGITLATGDCGVECGNCVHNTHDIIRDEWRLHPAGITARAPRWYFPVGGSSSCKQHPTYRRRWLWTCSAGLWCFWSRSLIWLSRVRSRGRVRIRHRWVAAPCSPWAATPATQQPAKAWIRGAV